MIEPLRIKRDSRGYLTVAKRDGRYDVSITGGPGLTAEELSQIEQHIGDDPDGQATLEKLRAR